MTFNIIQQLSNDIYLGGRNRLSSFEGLGGVKITSNNYSKYSQMGLVMVNHMDTTAEA